VHSWKAGSKDGTGSVVYLRLEDDLTPERCDRKQSERRGSRCRHGQAAHFVTSLLQTKVKSTAAAEETRDFECPSSNFLPFLPWRGLEEQSGKEDAHAEIEDADARTRAVAITAVCDLPATLLAEG